MRFKLPIVAVIVALTVVLAESAFGQAATTAQAKPTPRVSAFMAVNFGVVFPAQDAFTSKGSYAHPYFDETISWSYDYTVGTMKGIDVAGGVLFTSNLGVGIAVSSVGAGRPGGAVQEGLRSIRQRRPRPAGPRRLPKARRGDRRPRPTLAKRPGLMGVAPTVAAQGQRHRPRHPPARPSTARRNHRSS